MPLSWNEIKMRATTFTKEWKNEVSEDAEGKSFWDDFFNIFGIRRRRVATFEKQVQRQNNKLGYIDLLWKGVMLIEHKSKGKNLDKAYAQAKDYFPGLTEKELPRYILVSDFERFRLYDLETSLDTSFKLTELVQNISLFGFIAGYQKRTYKEQDAVNIEAAELMGKLHDQLKAIGYEGHALELYLVRLLFCLFADDTNIFEKGIFYEYLELRTNVDGSDFAMHLDTIFNILNTTPDKRYKNLDEILLTFPYVNGKLFEERLPTASFDSIMRKTTLDLCLLDWGKISPAIFGALFQSVMNPIARRNLGAHYTSETNILKVIMPLFMDELWNEFESAKLSKIKIQHLHDKISNLRFFDPACGCGNFLIIAYREIRLLEIEIIKQRLKLQGIREEVARDARIDISHLVQCDVDKFYGIEYEEFPAQIAQVAMWLIDHQMNQLVSQTFGEYFVRLPLRKSATIKNGNSLKIDWQSLITPSPVEQTHAIFDFILGNPPYVGAKFMNTVQRDDAKFVMGMIENYGLLDYVCSWFIKSCEYLQTHASKVAFVSTNSITQGEQVAILWSHLLKYSLHIEFAYRTFVWSNEARGNAAVHCVIIGLTAMPSKRKTLYSTDKKGSVTAISAININPYLIDYRNILIRNRSKPLSTTHEITTGNKPIDNGYYIFDDDGVASFIQKEPKAKKFFKKFIGAVEFINGGYRWILDLRNVDPTELRELPFVLERVALVRKYRQDSYSKPTQYLSNTPTRFHTEFTSNKPYLIIPEVSSERRFYLPIGYGTSDVVPSNKLRLIASESKYLFGVLSSNMHNCWIRGISGRLKSDIQYSVKITYNNFPWPKSPSQKQITGVESAAQKVLDARAKYSASTLADLYDPNTMPPLLIKSHQELDKAVDVCYRGKPFDNETKRIEFLFELYDQYINQGHLK